MRERWNEDVMPISYRWIDTVSFEILLLVALIISDHFSLFNRVTEPVVIEASDKFQIDYETPMKAAIGITSSHLYFVINGMLIFSESHKDLKFLERPLKYRITDDSLRIDEINVHSLEYELGSLRANQSKVNFVEDMKLHVPTTV